MTTRPRGACPRCSRDVALVGKAGTPAQHKCVDGICWPRSEALLRALAVDDRPPAARMEFTGAEHAMRQHSGQIRRDAATLGRNGSL